MASDEIRRRHNEAKARALAILNDPGIEARRERSRKAKAKALRLLAELDTKRQEGGARWSYVSRVSRRKWRVWRR